MTILTDVCGMRVVQVLADRVRAVVAADTVTGDIYVVEIRRQPCDGAVTIIAIVTAGNMRRVFAGCGNTIMA